MKVITELHTLQNSKSTSGDSANRNLENSLNLESTLKVCKFNISMKDEFRDNSTTYLDIQRLIYLV